MNDLERARAKVQAARDLADDHEVQALSTSMLESMLGIDTAKQVTALYLAILALADDAAADREAVIDAFTKLARSIPTIELVRS